MRSLWIAPLFVFGLVASGCPGSNGSLRSSVRSSCKSTTSPVCVDYVDYSISSSDCQGAVSAAACDLTGAIGGCEVTENDNGTTRTAIVWIYGGNSAAVKTKCEELKGSFVTP